MSAANPLTLTGKGFDLGSTSIKVSLLNRLTKKVTEVLATASTAISITITLPNLESGFYAVRARIDPLGESNALNLQVDPRKDSIVQSQISVIGGQVELQGWGFPSSWPNSHYEKLSLSSNKILIPLDFISLSTTKIVLRIPRGFNTKAFEFRLTSPTGISISYTFSQTDTNTPTVDLTSAGTITPNVAATISLTRTVRAATTPEIIELYSITDPSFKVPITDQTYNSTVINFPVTLKSGKYGFRLYDDTLGWFATTERTVLSVSQSGTYTVNPTTSSFNGGMVTVTGTDIG